ncbi:unnamed protein product [Candida verbasci]|uniref:Uncharacterized protein n=1 Tax=Candida verbasci TaxID=1227364 RepID=A0A9W4TU70_9ASCO|nr:unnamed protein product [Candida verbasci]
MPPPSTPSSRSNNQSNNSSHTTDPRSTNNQVQRFRNASTTANRQDLPPTSLNSLNLISDYMYRNLQPSNEQYSDEHESNFRSRILQHFSDIHRLQNHFESLVQSREDNRRIDEELAMNTIPIQLRNLTRTRGGAFESEEDDMDYEPIAHSDNIDEDSIVSEDELPNERLLLSSARQHTNPEGLFSPNQRGIPLRRQNAISRKDDEKEEVINNEAEKLLNEMQTLLKSIKAISPLFVYTFQMKSLRQILSSLNSIDESLNLDTKLDRYLQKRRNLSLWARNNETLPPPTTASKRKTEATNRPRKKQKISQDNNETKVKYYKSYNSVEKDSILNGLPSSFFQSGSNYILSINNKPSSQCEFIINDVHDLNGVFKFSIEESLETTLLKLHNFTKYFCGFDENSYNLPRNKILIRKLNVLDRISVDNKVNYTKLKGHQLVLPFQGHKIDFRKNDLRFLSDNSSTSSRFRSNKIRLQLLEWMKIQPFKQFKKSYFTNFILNLDFHLQTLNEDRLKKSKKTETINLANEFRLNVNELTKDFSNSKSTKKSSKRYTDLFMEDWERSLTKKLCDEITNEESISLLNVQLNYILFTIDLNISKFLDLFMEFIFNNCKGDYINNYKKVYNNILTDEIKDSTSCATLLCSIDRKLGNIEMENTLPYLHNKDSKNNNVILSRNQSLIDFSDRSTYVFDDFELFDDEIPLNSKTFNSTNNFENIETRLSGMIKMIHPGCDIS